MPASLIVFDLDGTIVDSRLDLAESANAMLAGYGAAALSVDAVTTMVGEGARVLVERVLAASGLDPHRPGSLEDFLTAYDRHLAVHTREYPGVREALESVSGRASVALLTNKPGHHTRKLLDQLDLTRFFTGGIVGGDAPWPRKPDPTGLRHLVSQAGIEASHALMVGDSMVDVETARRGGVPMCLVTYGFGTFPEPVPGPILVVESPTDLKDRLRQFLDGLS